MPKINPCTVKRVSYFICYFLSSQFAGDFLTGQWLWLLACWSYFCCSCRFGSNTFTRRGSSTYYQLKKRYFTYFEGEVSGFPVADPFCKTAFSLSVGSRLVKVSSRGSKSSSLIKFFPNEIAVNELLVFKA